jgi:hypothetical protein
MPAWIPVCRHRVGCARIKKAISEHGAFQHAGARFRTRGVSERLSGVSGRLAFRNGFWRSGTTGVPERLLAFRDGFWTFWHGFRPCRNAGRSGTGGGVPGTAARRSGMAKTRSGTRGVPEHVLPFQNGFWCSEAAIGGPERGGGVPERHRSELARRAACQHTKPRSGPRAAHSVPQHPHSTCDLYLYLLHYQHSHDPCMHSTTLH